MKVHYNSDKPAQLKAHAYAQGTDIHVASSQEKLLSHEAWHVAQQKQGRVKPTAQMKAFNINDEAGLEKEADVMGAKASNIRKPEFKIPSNSSNVKNTPRNEFTSYNSLVQRVVDDATFNRLNHSLMYKKKGKPFAKLTRDNDQNVFQAYRLQNGKIELNSAEGKIITLGLMKR